MAQSDWQPQGEVKSRKKVDERDLAARDRELVREGLAVAIRTMALSVALGSAALLVLVYFMEPTLVASRQILEGKGDFWYEAHMPAVLFGLFGAAFGVFAGWRLNSSGGVVGWPGWIVATAGVLAICTIGAIGATALYAPPVPFPFWIALGALALTTMLAMTFYTLWAA